jgi:hypothetical protein
MGMLFVLSFLGVLWGLAMWIVLTIAVTVGASNRGRSAVGWCFFAFFLSPVIAVIALAIMGPKSSPLFKVGDR